MDNEPQVSLRINWWGNWFVMLVKVFILGRPGSGKSTLAQLLIAVAQKCGWGTRHIYDYWHLYTMFQQEINDNVPLETRSFRQKGPDVCQGFDVCKFKVLDIVLNMMAEEVRAEERKHSEANKLLLIEFARDKYSPALHMFGNDILQGSSLFYMRLGLEDCMERVKLRADEYRFRSEYDHFVSEDIMKGFYYTDDWLDGGVEEYLAILKRDGIHIQTSEINNTGPREALNHKVEELVRTRLTSALAGV